MDGPIDFVIVTHEDGGLDVWRQCDECNEPVMPYDEPAARAERVICTECFKEGYA